jgi:hypothetical protein
LLPHITTRYGRLAPNVKGAEVALAPSQRGSAVEK